MDLWQAFKDSPNWIKADVVIVNFATLIVSIKVFGPLVRWCRMTIAWLVTWVRQTLIWVKNRPGIDLLDDPLPVNVVIDRDSQVWLTQFRIKLWNRDNDYPVSLSLQDLKLSLIQGWGVRSKHTYLTMDFAKSPRTVELQTKRELALIIYVKTDLTTHQALWEVSLHKPYRWSISGISALVHPGTRRHLRQIRGTRHGKESEQLGNNL